MTAAVRRGQVYFAPFPYSDQIGSKRRPVYVVSVDEYNQGPDVVVVAITSKRSRVASPGLGDVRLEDWQDEGLRLPSVARVGKLRDIEVGLLEGPIGQLTSRDLRSVEAALKTLLAL